MNFKLGLILAALFVSGAANATKIPIPIEGATLNVSFQLQTQFLVNQDGTPDGLSNSYDIFIRRSRLLINGDLGPNFLYVIQLDNPNFGKFGNFTGRALIQDAWVGWAPFGLTGGNVLFVDAGILLVPASHNALESTTNFITADIDAASAFRLPGSALPNLRDTGIQLRGWALNKRIGFRGGIYEQYTPATVIGSAPANSTTPAGTLCDPAASQSCVNPKRNPAFAAFVNFDLIGSEEGGWLYGAYKWGKDPILSVGLSGNYQSLALKTPFGDLTDQKLASADVYLNLPMSEQNELVVEATGYLNGNGTGSPNTGVGFSAQAGYRFGFIAPYAAYDYFQATSCDSALPTALSASCLKVQDSLDSRNFRAGLNFFINKNLNHINLEFAENHGVAAYGPATINIGGAGYVPTTLEPAAAGGVRRAFNANLRNPAYYSILAHWNFLF